MASDVDLEEEKKVLVELLKKLENVSLRFGGLTTSLASMDVLVKSNVKDSREANAIYSRIMKQRKEDEQEIIKAQRAGKMTYKEATRELKALNDKVAEVLPESLKSQFEYSVKASRLVTNSQLLLKDAVDLSKPSFVLLSATAKIAGNSLKDFVGVYQKNSNDIASATQFSTIAFSGIASATETAGTAIKDTGSTVSSFGNTTSKSGKYVKGFGIALEVAGVALNFFGKGLSETARSIIPILNAELDKVFTSFLQLNQSGAVFAGGMTDMIAAALRSNLTLDEFSDVVKSNSENLAKTGLGVSAAAQRMGDVSQALRRGGLDKQLYNLGFTYKDQAELVAETMALMRQSGGRLTANDDVVAQQTQKYAENLRIIASITGEDAKTKMKEAQQAANELAFQQKLAGMDETTRAGTIEAMASMSDIQRRAFMEQVVFGTQITRETAYAVNNIAGLGDSVNAYVQAFNDRTISAQKSLDIQNQFGGTIKNALLQEQDLARAGMANIDVAKSLTDAFGKELQFRNKFTEDATAAAARNVAAIEDGGGGRLQKSMFEAADAARDLKMAIQTELLGENGAIYGYSKIVAKANTEILDAINKLKKETGVGGANQEPTWFGKIGNYLSDTKAISIALKSTAAGLEASAAVSGMAGVATAPTGIGLVGFETVAAALGSAGLIAGGLGWLADKIGFAEGGISSGPNTGYFAKLHGTEAVLPPDLTDMLVNSASSTSPAQIIEAYNSLKSTTNEHLNATQDTNELLSMLNEKFRDMIELMDDVAGNTQRTAARVA